MQARIVCRDPPVLNQFLYGGGKGRVACMGICIQALYHLSEALRSYTRKEEEAILTPIQWGCVMSQGTRLWTLWREKYPNMVEEFPLADDLFALPQCAGFYKLFKKEIVERGGLARNSEDTSSSSEGSLQQLLASLVNKKHQYGYSLITMPGNSTVAVIYQPQPSRLFLFDPHGRAGTEDVTFLEFGDYRSATQYLLRRYQVGCIDHLTDEIYSLYNEMELADAYSYSASLFTNETS